MSVSDNQKKDFANTVVGHPAAEYFDEQLKLRLFERFINANDEERKVIGDILNAHKLLKNEYYYLLSEMNVETPNG